MLVEKTKQKARSLCLLYKIVNDFISVEFQYLQDTLGDFIQTLYEGEDDCEVGGKLDIKLSNLLFNNNYSAFEALFIALIIITTMLQKHCSYYYYLIITTVFLKHYSLH